MTMVNGGAASPSGAGGHAGSTVPASLNGANRSVAVGGRVAVTTPSSSGAPSSVNGANPVRALARPSVGAGDDAASATTDWKSENGSNPARAVARPSVALGGWVSGTVIATVSGSSARAARSSTSSSGRRDTQSTLACQTPLTRVI